MVDQGSQMAGNWERRRPEEGGGWETLYDKDGFAYYYSHYTGEQTYSMPKEYAHAQGIMTVSRPITDIPTAAIFHGHSPTRRVQQLHNQGQYEQHYGEESGHHEEQYQLESGEQHLKWEKHYDEDGYEYYYNNETGEQTYDIPADYVEPTGTGEHEAYAEEGHHEAATSIQRIVRGRQHREIARQKKELFDKMTHMHDDAIIDKSKIEAATKIQTLGRKYNSRKQFMRKKDSAILIQSIIRRKIARRNVKTIQNMSPVLARLNAAVVERHSLYGSEIKDYNDLFLKMDKDGDGKISKSDFLGAVNRLDIGMEENHINTLVWAMDSHSYTNDPKIDYDDFYRGIKVGKLKYEELQKMAETKRKEADENTTEQDSDSDDSEVNDDDNEQNNENIDSNKEEEEDLDEEAEAHVDSSNDEGDEEDDVEDVDDEGEESEANEEESEVEGEDIEGVDGDTKKDKKSKKSKSKKNKKGSKGKKKGGNGNKKNKGGSFSGKPAARPPVPKQYHEEFETLGVNEMMDSTKRVGFLRVTKAKLLKRIEEKADDGDAYRKLGFLLHEQKKYLQAVDKLQKGISLGYKNGRVWRTMGHCFYELDQVDSAREAYGRAMMHKSNEDAPLMFYRAARMEMRRGQYKNAYEILLNVESRFKKFKDRQSVWFALGASAHKIEEPRKALKYFKKALNEKDSETKLKMKGNFKRAAFYQMGRAYEDLEMFKNRIKCDKKAQKKMPKNEDGSENSELDSEANVSSDEEELTSNNTLDPTGKIDKVKRGDFHVKIASYLVSIKFHGLAVSALERALEINKKKPEWLSLLAYALHEQGKVKKATKVGERAEKLAAKSGDSWRASSSPWSPPLKKQLPAWRLEAIPPPVDVVISSYSPRSRPSSARSSRPTSAARSRSSSRPQTASSRNDGFRTPREGGGFKLSDEDISRLVEELAKKMLEGQLMKSRSEKDSDASDDDMKSLSSRKSAKKKKKKEKVVVKHEMSTQMTPREYNSEEDEQKHGSEVFDDNASNFSAPEEKDVFNDSSDVGNKSIMINSWSGRSQSRIKRVAALAARATQALAHALAFENGDGEEFENFVDDVEQQSSFNVNNNMEDTSNNSSPPVDPVSPNTKQKMRQEIITGPVTIEKRAKVAPKDINFKARRDLAIAKKVFERCKPDENGTVEKQLYLDTLEEDFDLQEFIRANSYCIVTPLLLRKVHLKVERTATPFERNTRISWEQIEQFLESHIHTSGKGAFNDNGDSYDPRFAPDSNPLRGQKEREDIAKKEAEEKLEAERQQKLQQQKLYESKLNDWPDEYKELDPAPDDQGFESVVSSDLDHKLSWQGPVHRKAPLPPPPKPPEKWEDPNRAKEYDDKRSDLLADLSVARTNYNVRDLEAKTQIARMEQELRIRNKKSKAHMKLAEREGSAAAVAALAANSEAVTREVERHITSIEESLAMRRARKGARNESYSKHVALDVVKRHKMKSNSYDGNDYNNDLDDRDEDSYDKSKKKGGKKIFVAGDDVEMRMLFADYEHGTDVRRKILDLQTVHPHITEEEAFLALAETGGNVDLAIGKLTDLGFFRDVRAVSNLHKETEAGAVIQATATALERSLDPAKERQDLVYKKFQIFRQNQEKASAENKPVTRIPGSGKSKEKLVSENVGGTGGSKRNDNRKKYKSMADNNQTSMRLARTVAQSPYMTVPFKTSTSKRPKTAGERRKMRERRKKGMADGMPGYIEGALKADRSWRKGGGMRRRLNRVVGRAPSLRKPSGGGSNAAKILHHNKVSKIGAFGGFNPTIDNPTQEYKAVIYAANELKPIPTEPFKTRSDYRSLQGDSVSADHRAVQRLSNLD